jgi:hypothetical protein
MTAPKPKAPPQSLVNELNLAKVREQIAQVAVRAVGEVKEDAWDRIKGTKRKIQSYRIQGGKVYLVIPQGMASLASSFGKDHWIEGINAAGVRGRIDNDFSFVSGSSTEVTYNTDLANLGLQFPESAYLYSVNPLKTTDRNTFGSKAWNELLSSRAYRYSASRVVTYDDLPIWKNDLNNNKDSGKAPESEQGLFGPSKDDVRWYETIHEYYKHCVYFKGQKTKERLAAEKAVNDSYSKTNVKKDTNKSTGSGSGKTTNTPPSSASSIGIGDDSKPVIHNLPPVKDLYFGSEVLKIFSDNRTVADMPTKVAPNGGSVASADKLWKDTKPYKGMIQSHIVPAKLEATSKLFRPQDKLKGLKISQVNSRRFGFQFQYNPSTVTMNYAGAPQVDIGLQMSGADKIPLIGSGVTSSTITFSVILNRMHDFKYIDAIIGKQLKFENVYAHTGNHKFISPIRNEGETTVVEELKKIKELGTMYDLEYLLRTLLGYQLNSTMRSMLSSDVGYLGAYPVELHLGKNLRYLGIIDGFSVSHTIFTQDMVPVFTNVQIQFSRLPDFTKRWDEVGFREEVDSSKEEDKT